MRLAPLAALMTLAVVVGVAGTASAQAVPNYDFQWVTVGDVNNPAYDGPTSNGYPAGRGSVSYEYRISKLEVSAAQWLEFVNTFGPLGDPYRFGQQSEGGGIERVIGGQLRWVLQPGPAAERRPATRISWRAAAMFCNWLHNDKRAEVSALLTGAYDTSTWGENPPGTNPRFTDAPGRMPGAKFWLPSVDEWLKAVHYDPDRNGPGEGGYWLYPNTSDTAPRPGQSPLTGGNGQTNAGYTGGDQLSYRIGAYPQTQTPWGLLDATGSAGEWLEDWLDDPGFETNRIWDGAPLGLGALGVDRSSNGAGSQPIVFDSLVGIRVASLIPSPGTASGIVVLGIGLLCSRRRTPQRAGG